MKIRWLGLTVALLTTMPMQSCMMPRTPEASIATRFYSISPEATEHLIVLLPGRGDAVDSFDTAGFIEAMRDSSIQADAIALDAHLGYYVAGQLADRVRENVLTPYREAGYRRFTLVGVSLGGYGSLWLANELDDWFQGALLIAPYLGPRKVINSVAESESLGQWLKGLGRKPNEDEYAWLWLHRLSESGPGLDDRLLLAYGKRDKFAKGGSVASGLLPDRQVFRNDGGHDWKTWLELWRDVLESPAWAGLLAQSRRESP